MLELLAGAMVKLTEHENLSRGTVRRRLAEALAIGRYHPDATRPDVHHRTRPRQTRPCLSRHRQRVIIPVRSY